MEFIIVSGQSGAGKSKAIDALEDIGFYCIDNVPAALIPQFATLLLNSKKTRPRVAIVTDVRGSEDFSGFFDALTELKTSGIDYKILYLESSEEVLINRFKETRRAHPLQIPGGIREAVRLEREILKPVRQHANYIMDTSHTAPAKLKDMLVKLFLNDASAGMVVQCTSFGFKFGGLSEADLVFDVRCLPNPYHDEALRPLTGLDEAIKDFVLEKPQTKGFMHRLIDMIDFLLPLYCEEGKSRLSIGIGCTGGKHRSVALTEELAQHLSKLAYRVNVDHRDIDKV